MVAFAGASVAHAGPGDHIKVGAFELAPSVDVGSEYRTNVYRSEENPVGAANLALGTGLGLKAMGDDHQFTLGGRWEMRKFFFVGEQQIGVPQTAGQRIGNLDRFDNGSANLALESFKRSSVGFSLRDDFTLQNTTADAEFADLPYTSQLRNSLEGEVRLAPTRAFALKPGGQFVYDDFRVPRLTEGGDRSLNERSTYGPMLGAEWRFLPKTSLVFDSELTFQNWSFNSLESNSDEDESIELPNSTFVKARAGLDGQVSRKLFAKLLIGYGVGTYQGVSAAAQQGASGLDGILARAELRYDLSAPVGDRPGSRLRGGYTKDFTDSFFSNYLALNAFDVEYTGRIGRFEPSANYSLRFEKYNGELQRNDVVNRVGVDLATPFGNWARLAVGGWWQQRASNTANVEFDDFHIRLLTSFAY